jgi:energy-coupling factor transport system substrate-specific component
LIGDFFGGLGPGDLFGFVANLAYGFVAYALWEAVTDAPPTSHTAAGAVGLLGVIALASLLCATIVGWGLHTLGFHPFTVLAPIVFLNNVVAAGVLAPPLLRVLHPRIANARLLYRDVLGPRPPRSRSRARRLAGVVLVIAGTLGAFAAGHLIASGHWHPPWAIVHTASRSADVGLGLVPILAIVLVGCILL